MGELFRRHKPDSSLAWTGERLVSGVGGRIESEHLHRYCLARELCRGKAVVDVASGEGYGTALLAQTARSAVGIELDPESVKHASEVYQASNLSFLQGDATHLPLQTESVDVIVSFETLEHFFHHEIFFEEVQRVLRTDGLLIVSTPDSDVYSGAGIPANPFHIRELTRSEFLALLRKSFFRIEILRQRAFVGSLIVPNFSDPADGIRVFEQRDLDIFEGHQELPHAPYLIAVASRSEIPTLGFSAYIQADESNETIAQARSELERLQQLEVRVREQAPLIERELAVASTAREDIAHSATLISQLEAELETLRKSDQEYRKQDPIIQEQLLSAARAREEITRSAALVSQLEVEIVTLRKSYEEYRRQDPIIQEQLRLAVFAQAEAAQLRVRVTELEGQLSHLQKTEADFRNQVHVGNQLLSAAKSSANENARRQSVFESSLQQAQQENRDFRHQLDSSELLLRQQTLSCLRLQQQLASHVQNILTSGELAERHKERLSQAERARQLAEDSCCQLTVELQLSRETTARFEQLSNDLANLIVPVWVRKLVPRGLRPAARAIKRSMSG